MLDMDISDVEIIYLIGQGFIRDSNECKETGVAEEDSQRVVL